MICDTGSNVMFCNGFLRGLLVYDIYISIYVYTYFSQSIKDKYNRRFDGT